MIISVDQTIKILRTLFFTTLFLLFITHPVDLDLGWHLKYGEYIWNHRDILRTNIFSTTMPGYSWINTTTGTDFITYVLYRMHGFVALSLIGAVLTLGTVITFTKAARFSSTQLFLFTPIIVYLTQPYWLISFRGQLISIFFLGILSLLLRRAERKSIHLILIPLLFLIWTNVHGQVIVGVIVLVIWLFSRLLILETIREKLLGQYLITLIFSLIACLINPYGHTIFSEFLKYIGNPVMEHIGEWMPFQTYSEKWWQVIGMGLLLIIGIGVIQYKQKTREYFGWIVLSLLFLSLTLMQRRYGIMFYFFSLPILAEIVPKTVPFIKGHSKKKLLLLSLSLISIILLLTERKLAELKNMSWNTYCDKLHCPINAAEYLATTPWVAPILTYYDWGGWLIWNYPGIPPGIDGRMPLWKNHQGESPFIEYSAYITQSKDIEYADYNTVFIPQYVPLYNRLLDLELAGKWKTVYEDDMATVFIRMLGN